MGDMDSGNSGSIQSSSTGGGGGCGDDQEFESSRGVSSSSTSSMSTFFNTSRTTTSMYMAIPSFGNMVPSQIYSLTPFDNIHPQTYHDNFNFDPSNTTFLQSSTHGNNFVIDHSNNNHNYNSNSDDINISNNSSVDMVWPNKYGSITSSISPSSFVADDANCTTGLASTMAHIHNDNPVHQVSGVKSIHSSSGQLGAGAGRNPKKRSRATRKAPTTVLTTDTNNFRQMVQEFTGIPAPPFTAFPGRTRLDLFGGLGIQLTRAGPNPPNLNLNPNPNSSSVSSSSAGVQLPPYILRPSPQKIVPQSITAQPSTISNGISSVNNNAATNTVNPLLAFQSFLQQPSLLLEKYSLPDYQRDSVASIGSPKATGSLLNQFALGHTTTATAAAAATTKTNNDRQVNCSVNDNIDGEGRYNVANEGMPVNVPHCDDHGGVARSEGMVNSWICSSD